MSKARQLADNGAATPNRNMIINGAMNVAQRGTSTTGIGITSGYFTVDRVKYFHGSGTDTAGRLTMTQTADGPSGFANCLKLACTTADTSIASDEQVILQVNLIEGQNLQRIKKGTSDAEEITVSFYVKGNASATYCCEVFDLDNSRQASKTFAVTTSWNRIELTFPADTTGAYDDDNAASFVLNIWIHAGSNYTSGTLSQTWTSNTAANRAVGISSFFDSTDRTFFLTGVQMEVGSSATPFEFESYATTLAKCQRYCQRHPSQDPSSGSGYNIIGDGHNDSTSNHIASIVHFLPMRADTTITVSGDTRIHHAGAGTATSSVAIDDNISNADRTGMNCNVSGTPLTAGQGAYLEQNNDTDAHIILDAEL